MAKLLDGTLNRLNDICILSDSNSKVLMSSIESACLSRSFAELIAKKFQSAESHGRATGEDAPQHPSGIAGKRANSRLVFVSNC